MAYTVDEVKADIGLLTAKDFYLKHILRSDNWYFENIIGENREESIRLTDELKSIISKNLQISFHNITVVGSSKIGCSLTPKTKYKNKLFRSFDEDRSDIDIAIVSDKLFQNYWELFRKSYSPLKEYQYGFIKTGIYRGYINERDLESINGCRKKWLESSLESKKILRRDLYIKPEVTYRLYRSWEDFEEYHIQSINQIMRGDD